MTTDTHFTGKVAVVTGGASGIGRAIGTALARRGASVVLADVDEVAAKAAAEEIGAGPPGRVAAAGLDVRDAEAFATLVGRVAEEHGHLDLLFNNAGIGIGGEVAELTLGHWDRVIDINLRGVVHGVVAAYPLMIRQGHGHIVNTASIAGLFPSPLLTPYAATKHAVVGLSTSLRGEAANHGVRVSVVCPGIIDTPIWERLVPEDLPDVPSARIGFERVRHTVLRRAYPPDALAEDVLAGVARNRPIIVAPAHARLMWRIYRAAPRLVLDGGGVLVRRLLGS
ncbi:MAG TPA: SDR family oxidoreductase [Acidimicrobiales bacterium]|nr:SDR family oxidoreductase [Acidimicrobiales bacterium]